MKKVSASTALSFALFAVAAGAAAHSAGGFGLSQDPVFDQEPVTLDPSKKTITDMSTLTIVGTNEEAHSTPADGPSWFRHIGW